MSALLTRSKDTIVATIAAGMQGRVSRFLNFAVGSVFLALAEAHAGVALWLQGEILKVVKLTRAATSDGTDLDSWVADYGLARLPARAATGLVTLSRFTAAPSPVTIPVGALVQNGDGSQRFAVYADSQNSSYSAEAGGYIMPANVASLLVPVQAVTPGRGGNVASGAVTLVASAISGVDAVTNQGGFINGADAESDLALRSRFRLFINSLAKATEGAIGYAIASLGQGLQYVIRSNQRLDGTFEPGFVTVIVDDGSGQPSDDLVALARAAVGDVRAAGVRFTVVGAQVLIARIGMFIEVERGYAKNDVIAQVTNALSAYINGLGLGAPLRYTRLENVAYTASPGVSNVTSVTLNGSTADLIPLANQTIKAGNLGVS